MLTISVEQALQAAMAHHHAGQLAAAEGLFRQVLVKQPDHPIATHRLGWIALVTQHRDEALALLAKAVALSPGEAQYHCDLGIAQWHFGAAEASMSSLRQ